MAVYTIPYPGLNESLKHLRVQVIHSLPYAVRNCPKDLKTPEAVFKYCKEKFIYKSDPIGVELFQTVPTLLTANVLGTPGSGDCDDATIFVLTILLINGFSNCGIVLTGRQKSNPTHIYAYCDDNGTRKILDLTNKNFNEERPYPFKQFIPFKISKNQLDMFLQLADGNQPRKFRVRKLTQKQKEKGIYIPSKNVFIPVEHFDKLPIKHAKQTLLSEGYEVEQLSEYLSGRKERKERKQYRKEKKNIKLDKKRANVSKKEATAQKRRDKGTSKKIRAQAKVIKAKKGPSGKGMNIFNKVTDVAKGFVNRKQGGEEEEEENPFAPRAQEGEEQDFYNPEEANEFEPENVEGEEVEAQEGEEENTELEEGFPTLVKNDYIGLGLFVAGIFLEKTKKVA